MEMISQAIYRFRLGSPAAYVVIVILLPVLTTLILAFMEKKLHIDGTPLGILMLGLPAVEAVLLAAGPQGLGVVRLIIFYVVTMALIYYLTVGLNRFTDKILPRKRFARLARNRDYQQLEKEFAHDGYNSWSGIEDLDDTQRRDLARACLPSKEYGEEFYRYLIQRLDRETVRELLNDPQCNLPFRVCLFACSPEDAHFSDWSAVFDYAEKSLTAASILQQNISAVVPRLSYPAHAKELRGIVTGVKKYELSARKKALQKIPKTDEAYRYKYCPFCGSTKIKSGYLGLFNDMYYYGHLCQDCGHRSAAPEGLGEAADFRVRFDELVK